MNYYIDLIREGDGTFTIGPYKSPPLIINGEVYADNDQLALMLEDSVNRMWFLYPPRADTAPPDPDTLAGYDSFQIRVEGVYREAPQMSAERSEVDGVWVIQIDTPGMDENRDGSPRCRVYLNDGVIYENPVFPGSHLTRAIK